MTGLSQRRASLVARLRESKSRAKERAVLVEGVRAVREALDASVAVTFALTSPKLTTTEEGWALAARLEKFHPVGVDDGELARLSDTERHQGVALVCEEPVTGPDRIGPGGTYLVLDRLQDPGNAGTLIRSAVAFGLDGVACLDGTVDPWGSKTVRASAGMVFRIPVVRATAGDVIDRLKDARIPILVADAGGADVAEWRQGDGFALVVGNEGAGVRQELMDVADARLAVPMRGPAESLNAAMAGAILMYALVGEPPRD